MIDTHAHLCDPAFASDLPEVLARARAAGVEAIVAVGETLADAERNLELAAAHPDLIRPAAGLFPTVLDAEQADRLIEWIRAHRAALAAIGEVGLDHWRVREEPARDLQREIFVRFIDLAVELDLPLNVHSRAAGRATIDLLLARGARRVQLHAFDGRAASALPAAEAGYFFSVPPSVVRSAQKQKLVRRLPVERLLLETDSPALAADPGARNEPEQLRISLAAIAELKDLDPAAVREITAANARALYGDLAGSLSG
ncbi:MAG: TatD family hydrolase [Thermoanaerobaculia bacterium]